LPLSAVDAVSPALQHAQQQLTRPFRFGQWVRLAFVGALAGETASFGGCNTNFNSPTPHAGRGSAFFPAQFPAIDEHSARFLALAVIFAVVGIVLVVLFTYIGSVMKFILFDSVVSRECHVRAGWRRRKHDGFQLFLWQILFALICITSIVILVGAPVLYAWALGWFREPSQHLVPLILWGLSVLLLFLGLLLFFAIIQVMTTDFVVPEMALQEIDAFEGWRRLLPKLNAEKLAYAAYIGMKIVLAIGAAIVFLLIPFGGVGLVAVFTGKAMGLTWNVGTITVAVIYCCIAAAVFIFAALLIAVPKVVFFPAYSIHFFAPRFPPLAALLAPPPAPPASPPPEPPPLPPTPEPIG
jgi:MFS family permease